MITLCLKRFVKCNNLSVAQTWGLHHPVNPRIFTSSVLLSLMLVYLEISFIQNIRICSECVKRIISQLILAMLRVVLRFSFSLRPLYRLKIKNERRLLTPLYLRNRLRHIHKYRPARRYRRKVP